MQLTCFQTILQSTEKKAEILIKSLLLICSNVLSFLQRAVSFQKTIIANFFLKLQLLETVIQKIIMCQIMIPWFLRWTCKHFWKSPTLSFQRFQLVLENLTVLLLVVFNFSIWGQHNCPVFRHSRSCNPHCKCCDWWISELLRLLDQQKKIQPL